MKRINAVLGAVGLASLLLAGCGNNANSENQSGSGTQTLTAVYSEGGQTLSPYEANDVTSDTFVTAAYDQLVTYATTEVDGKPAAKTDEIVPMLAKSWEESDDHKTYTFELRDDVKFESGNPLTADDVVTSFDLIKDSASASSLYQLAGIDKVKKVGDTKVEIALNAPNHLFLQIIPMYSFSIVDAKTVESNGGADWLAKNTAGSGPYTVESWNPSTEAKLKRKDDYWGQSPDLAKVDIKFIAEPSNRVQLLEKGEAQLATEIQPKDVDKLSSADGVKIDSRKSNKILYFAMNNKIKPFDDPLVRQAISYAIPYDQLIDDVMMGQAGPMKSAVASSTPGWTDKGNDYEHNLDKAKELLSQSGHGDGFSFDFTLGSGFQDWNDDAVRIQAELKKIGVTMNIKNMARPQFLEATDKGEVQAFISRWTSFVNDPGYHLGLLLKTGGSSNNVNYSNPEVDNLLKSAATQPDQDERNKLYAQAQEMINKDAPWAYLYEYNIVVGLSSSVEGYTSYPDGIVRFAQLSNSGD